MNGQYDSATSYTGALTTDILKLAKLVEELKAENATLRAENARLKVVEAQAETLYNDTYGQG